ncbi:reverse transcriptase domain-containing protein [Adlercreutzia shanghongiae]|uniref:RNA-directed DNA polymerase n=1 Tax=Adlercreutzia shanghongiae TaxID=3111773 RepID=A0ABU6J154_9ACTN|nr:reverse transcriptase domain-containing protein [Adlercreutzia sp. R22]MEC4295663.1 reverse transcriptase domain-containing protein [Adlercreutzia sp. R22]
MSVVDAMAGDLLIDKETIRAIACASNNYRRIELPNGRVVWQPAAKLKILQYWVMDYIARKGPLPHKCATAYEPGCSIRENALRHRGCRHMLRLDIRHFFPSVRGGLLNCYLSKPPLGDLLDDQDASLILRISTFKGGLVMGAPSSPMLANRAMLDADREIEELARAHDPSAVYTRYSDDIAISSQSYIDERILLDISRVLHSYGFEINKKKIRWMGKGSARTIAGVSFAEDGRIALGQRRKCELKRRLYEFAMDSGATNSDARMVLGHLNFARSIEPEYVDRLLVKYSVYGELPVAEKIARLVSC